MSRYDLVSHWHLEAPMDQVWLMLIDVESWPRWWSYVQQVVVLERGDAQGVGAVHRVTWGTRLPHQLTLTMKRVIAQSPWRMEALFEGDLHGTGRWLLREQGSATVLQHDWDVTINRGWMNVIAPLLGPMFRWNYSLAMADGARGLTRFLAAQ